MAHAKMSGTLRTPPNQIYARGVAEILITCPLVASTSPCTFSAVNSTGTIIILRPLAQRTTGQRCELSNICLGIPASRLGLLAASCISLVGSTNPMSVFPLTASRAVKKSTTWPIDPLTSSPWMRF